MKVVHPRRLIFLAWMCLTIMPAFACADERITLLGTITKWRYPEAEIGKAEMSDAATVNSDQKNTAPSVALKTTMVTPDPVEKVVAFYRELLTRNRANDEKLGIDSAVGQSVVFSDESEGRTFAFHTIAVNSPNSSTTLIITRGNNEGQTYITWKQYRALIVGK